jgi:hypothetical protein
MELYAVKLFFFTEWLFSGGAVTGSVTKGINSIDATHGGGAEFAVQPNTVIASP